MSDDHLITVVNPGFSIEVRRNLIQNPQGTAPTAAGWNLAPRWGGTGATVSTTTVNTPVTLPDGTQVDSFRRKTYTVAPTAAADIAWQFMVSSTTTRAPVTAGKTYTLQYAWRKSFLGTQFVNRFEVRFYTDVSAGTEVGTTVIGPTLGNPAANVWQQDSFTFTVPATATHCVIYHYYHISDPGVIAVGSTFDATAALAEAAPAGGKYFDGEYSPDPDLTPSWLGSANASESVLTASEIRLDTLAFGIVTKGGLHGTQSMKSPGIDIPGRTGTVYYKGRRRGPGFVYLKMYVQECDEVGYVAPDSYPKFLENKDKLFALFNTRFNQIAIREYTDLVPAGASLAGYNYREAICEVEMAIAPELRGRYWGELVVECKINDGSWREKTVNTINVGAAVGTYNLTALAGSTEDIEDAILSLTGPITNPKITDPLTGHYIQLNQTVAAGTQWVVDCKTWASVVGTGLSFNTTAGTNVTANTVSVGSFYPSLYGISADTMPKMALAGTGLSGATLLQVRARRRFL